MPGRKGRAAAGRLRLWPSQGDIGTDELRPPPGVWPGRRKE